MSESLEQKFARMELRLRVLEDRESIRQVLGQYCNAVDLRDAAALAPLFSRDARVTVVPWNVDVRGHDAVMAFFVDYFGSDWREPRHNRANECITADGDAYRVFSYFHETVARGEESIIGWGTWEDRFVCEDGAWKIAERVITILALTPITKSWAGTERIMAL